MLHRYISSNNKLLQLVIVEILHMKLIRSVCDVVDTNQFNNERLEDFTSQCFEVKVWSSANGNVTLYWLLLSYVSESSKLLEKQWLDLA